MTWRNRKSFPSIIKFNDYKNHQQHPYCVSSIGPKSCGRPEQPANGTLLAENFNVGNRVEYRCDPGHMAVGPTVRTCLSSGFYSEYPPVCKCKNYTDLFSIAQLSSNFLQFQMSNVVYRLVLSMVATSWSTIRATTLVWYLTYVMMVTNSSVELT